MAYYYRDYGGPAIGPASEAELIKLAQLGVISPTTEVRSGMSPTWFAATKIPGIVFTAQLDNAPEIASENAIGRGMVPSVTTDTEHSEYSDISDHSKASTNASFTLFRCTPKRWWNILEIILEIACVATIAHILYYMQPPVNTVATCTHRIPFSPVAMAAIFAAIWGALLLGRLVRLVRRR